MAYLKKLQYNTFRLVLLLFFIIGSTSLLGDSAYDATIAGKIAGNKEKPLIVTTIKPLAIIAKSAVGEHARVETLQSPGQSGHDVTLTVSSLKRVEQSALIIWVGSGFEGRLGKSLELQPREKQLLLSEMDFLPARNAGQSGQHHHDHHHGEMDLAFDPHIWLNPANANIVANSIQQRLGLPISPVMSQKLLEKLKGDLAPYSSRAYLTHHDAYGHFVEAFGLRDSFSIRDASGNSQGARSQYQLRREVEAAGVSCIFIEPQLAEKDARGFSRELDLPLVELDPQGIEQQLTADGYSQFMVKMAGQFKACFN